MKEKNNMSLLKLLGLSGALFSMHFGASSMIWPMTWGRDSGSSVYLAFFGAYITAVFIPLLGYFALAKGGSFLQLSRTVSDRFASIFCNITILVLGPLFVIPRMSAAAWEAFLQISGYEPSNIVPTIIFTILYYSLVYWFVASKDNILDKISKLLLPVLLIVVVGVVFKGIRTPLSIQGPKTYSDPAFIYGLLEGYATMELPTALLLGGIIVNSLKRENFEGQVLSSYLIKIGMIGTGILALSHFAHMYIGSTTSNLFSDLMYSSLYAAVVVKLWGTFGGIIFNVGLLFAALSCAVGLSSSTAHFYEEYTNSKISYNKAIIYIVILSGLVATLGLEQIVKITAPLLKVIYPPAIVLTLSFALINDIRLKKSLLIGMKVSVYLALFMGIIEGLLEYFKLFNLNIGIVDSVLSSLPLYNYGLSWMVLSFLAFAISSLYVKFVKT